MDANGRSFLQRNTEIECGSREQLTLLGVAIPGLIIYGILFSLVVAAVLWRHRHQLKT